MSVFWKKHVFTAELPYEKDAVATRFFRRHFERVDDFIMSLGQMTRIPPNKLNTYKNNKLVDKKIFTRRIS